MRFFLTVRKTAPRRTVVFPSTMRRTAPQRVIFPLTTAPNHAVSVGLSKNEIRTAPHRTVRLKKTKIRTEPHRPFDFHKIKTAVRRWGL